MSSNLFDTFQWIIVKGPLGEFGLALSAPQVTQSSLVLHTTLNNKSQIAQTTFAFSSWIFLLFRL